MGKRFKDSSSEDDLNIDISDVSPQRRHKKHKHKKHRKKKSSEEIDSTQEFGYDDCDKSNPYKVKIRFPKDADKTQGSCERKEKGSCSKSGERLHQNSSSPKISKKKKGKGKDSGTSSEEERWLDAIESGTLEEVDDELKKIKPKDPKLMTARQRAMFERKTDKEPCPGIEPLMALPSGYKEKVMTEEALQKAALKSQKRKQLADEKREKDKKKTMERLLKKQESKSGKAANRSRPAQKQIPRITYCINVNGLSISLPPNVEFPLKPQLLSDVPLPTPVKCGVLGCDNWKKYSCSKTGVPLCSLQCYKKNLNMNPQVSQIRKDLCK